MKNTLRDIKIGGFRLLVVSDYEALSRQAASMLYTQAACKPDSHISIATGASPQRAYGLWAEKIREARLSTDALRIHKLDEWLGVTEDDPASCEYFLRKYVIGPLGIGPDRYDGIRNAAPDADEECRRMAEYLRTNPLDLSVLGVGTEGHLGLNEAGESFVYETHKVKLADSSRQHQMLEASDSLVEYGMTTGIGEIMNARSILFLVSGEKKREVFRHFMRRLIAPSLPASVLWLHRDVTCVCDRDAAALWMEEVG